MNFSFKGKTSRNDLNEPKLLSIQGAILPQSLRSAEPLKEGERGSSRTRATLKPRESEKGRERICVSEKPPRDS
jgi:hypothetical protein